MLLRGNPRAEAADGPARCLGRGGSALLRRYASHTFFYLPAIANERSVPFSSGCLIVEVHDHRSDAPTPTLTRPGFQLGRVPQAAPVTKAEVYRIVLGPNPATLWTELGILEKRMMDAQAEATAGDETAEAPIGWTEEQAVEIEAAILVSELGLCGSTKGCHI